MAQENTIYKINGKKPLRGGGGGYNLPDKPYNYNNVNEHKPQRLEIDLRQALQRQEFFLCYQPNVDLIYGKITGVEALIRWKHPEKGLISPIDFIPLAEETGLILPIGDWVLRMACKQHQKWREAGLPSMTMAVNVSGRQLQDPTFVERIQTILHETKFTPNYLEIEITESTMMDVHRVLPVLKDLKSTGVRISLDDFGTGFSSLLYLREFPIDQIKIDQSFVRDCTVDTKDATIIQATIAMAHQLKLDVVAEGLETRDHLIFLQQNLCNKGQGYFLSKPLLPDELERKWEEIIKVVHLEGIPQEVYRGKWLEDELEKARQELRDTIRQQQGMIFKFIKKDEKFIHTLCDGELVHRIGLIPEQIVGRELTDFRNFDDAQRKLEYYRRAWAGEDNVTYEAEYNGVWYLASLRPIRRGGQVVEVIASCIDITERVKKEQEITRLTERLIEQEAKYRLIAENSDDFIIIFGVDGTIQYSSPSHDRLLGISTAEREGTPGFTRVHPDDLSYTKQLLHRVICTKTAASGEWRYMKADGSYIWVESLASPILTIDGEVNRVLVVAREISERKQTEDIIRKSERLSVAGQLAAGVAHEIRNPLMSIKGFTQLLKNGGEKPLYTEMILSEITRIEHVVDEFLSLARSHVHQVKEVDIKILLEEVLTLFGTQATLKSVEIVDEYDTNLPHIPCDENQIKLVFINILQNAVEAMPDGGILKIETRWLNSASIRLRFIDQGCGITEERLRHIGEPFYSTKEKGTGLGLTISQKIVHEHGGAIRIDSVLNQGTIVDVILPVKHTVVS
ncbi:EAL domain-containing protein [Alicyclobacillus sp. ALC3]|uniref:EAL domain-containing protein n=1 Tax=Alicyclobacillus sp. ALC3 TaxID=2796143 RepID=UPI00237881EA|nr:EAL domain-containing protein [Alicyclobacillus sp. ALC3]WDL98886.1 EAL domain-containing protein [Alicyclobacillus sp. ALC3]